MTVSLAGISYIENVNAASGHNFESQWGQAGIFKSGFFLSPQHLAFDSENNVYVTDLGNSRVQKFDSTGNFLIEWGNRGSSDGEFGHPTGIAVSDEFVFVVDNKNHNIQKFTLDGEFISKWGGFGKDNGFFKSPRGIIVSDYESVYVVDSGNARIQKFTLDGEFISGFGQSGKRGGNFVSPVDIAINSDKIYVTDPNQNKIIVFDLEGNLENIFNDSIGGKPIYPEGIIFDEEDNFYIVDYRNNRIIHYNEFGVSLSIFGQMGNDNGHFKFPKDVAISNDGYLFITDTQGHRIQKFSTPLVQNSLIIEEEQNLQTEITPESEKIEDVKTPLQPVIPIPNDFQKPVILVPEDILVEATGPLTSIDIGEAMATDESGIYSLTNNAPSSFPLGINTIIWTAVDGAGNMAIASQTVTIQDSTPPKISAIDDISLEAKSSSQNLVTLTIPEIYDEVGVMSTTNDAPEVFPLGETIVTWTATDVIGNISNLSQSIILVDSTAPRIAFSEDLIIEASSLEENILELVIPETSDDVEVISVTNDAPTVFPLGETIVTWTATDSSGNSSSQSYTITFVDTIIPEILTSDETFEATIFGGTNTPLEFPEIIDIQNAELTNDAPTVFPLGETIVTWTATDSSGNSASATQTIIVVDTTSPILIAPENLTIEAESTLTQIENLGEFVAEDISGITTVTNDAPEVFPLGETIVTWTATDDYGNSISNTQSITVLDTISPVIMAPSDFQLEASHIENNVIDLIGVRASDDVEVISITNDAPTVFPLGETIVTWTATDSSGNSASDSQQISVIDTTIPSIIAPNDIQVEIYDKLGVEIDTGIPTSDDVIDSQPVITNDAPTVFPLGETIVTWTATDSSGNSASATQTITVVDTTSPILIAPESIIQEAINHEANPVRIGISEYTDIMDITSITNDAPEVFPLGETIVTWTATDSSGNSASATQTITVVDTTSPVVENFDSLTFEATAQNANLVEIPLITASDNTEIISITNDAPVLFEFGTTIINWSVVDIIGNQSVVEQQIDIIDTTLPTIISPVDVEVEATSMENNLVEFGFAEASDQVEISTITNDAPTVFPLGETIIIWTATDSSGNSASATQTITVVDTTAPVITTPENITSNATSKLNNIVELEQISVIDSISTVQITNNAPSYYEFGETIVTWTATDSSGNSASATQTITVVDTTAPVITTPQNIIVDAVNTETLLEIGSATIDDIIDDRPIITNDSPTVFPLGETIVTWTATDKFGNTSSSLQTISVQTCGNDPLSYNLIVGSEEDDILIGTALSDLIFANGGDDIISGDKGNDCILAGDGDDIIFGNQGNDHISGQGGNDIIKGQSGEDFVFGGLGLDVIDGGDDIDTCKVIDEQSYDIVIKCESNE
ncbi:HYR domain protein [Candidatus Nitrosopelagicus brevis]|uniref:HYR domain protein n=1 Tax=Candidatus Nitrosopelagicus brevis TaxID=1410606 RepID=A0A0A7V2H5_9ARCH|nr:HYR domain protein [Candidatus Nitrosopelagicus brevis]